MRRIRISKNSKSASIAGNDSAILLTVLVPSANKTNFENAQTVFTQPVSSDLSMKRVALAVPVKDLNKRLFAIDKQHIKK